MKFFSMTGPVSVLFVGLFFALATYTLADTVKQQLDSPYMPISIYSCETSE